MRSRKLVFGILAAFGLLLVGTLTLGSVALPALAQNPMGGGMMGNSPYGQTYTGTMPYGWGMMGGWPCPGGTGYLPYGQAYTGTLPYGYGMMGMMSMMGGYGYTMPGIPGAWGAPGANAQPISLDQASQAVKQYLAATNNPDLEPTEVMEFTLNFYAEIHEKSTGTGAFELLVDRYTGAIYPEPGPNMMWNAKYGPMAGGGTPGGQGMMGGRGMMGGQGMMGTMLWWDPNSVKPSVTAEQAVQLAQQYLDRVAQGLKAGDAEPFYGYYTLHTTKDGQITGMLSVNAYTGAVWYHAWHGDFVRMAETTQQ